MKKNLFWWTFSAFAVTSLLGTLLHFAFDWTGGKLFVAPFSAVNESTWEHMKLAFFPMVAFALFQRIWYKRVDGYWKIKAIAILLALFLVPALFYTVKGVVGKVPDWVNIVEFFVTLLIAYGWEYLHFTKPTKAAKNWIYLSVLAVIALSFALFTFFPPKWAIFVDPVTLGRGIV